METKIIKVTDKGQISLPINMRQELCINQGDDLIIMKTDKALILKKVNRDDFSDLLKHSENVAKKLWSNKEDEIWNNL
jgi:AbrB family looped-hinge helix DNA binding protein